MQDGPGDGTYSSAVFRPEPPVIRTAEDDLIVADVVDAAVVGYLVVAEAHVCRTKMMFLELAKGWDQYFCTQDTSSVQGICVAKSKPFTFWYFWPINGPKRPKNRPKMS